MKLLEQSEKEEKKAQKAPVPQDPGPPAPAASPPKAAPPNTPAPKAASPRGKRRKKPSPVPASMWLLPSLRLPFQSGGEFLRWFFTGINFWAVGAVLLCSLCGWGLVTWLGQPAYPGAEQALEGASGTAGLRYSVRRTGEREVTVTGSWNREKGEEPPDGALAAALCAALSPEEIYGHSTHLYQSIARRFFEGKDFSLTVSLTEDTPQEKGEEPWKPIFEVTRGAGEETWPDPVCSDEAFLDQWKEAYGGFWIFGQGRKEEMGPPQSDPIIEEGDRPPDPSEEEEVPPLPDLDGEDGSPEPSGGEGDSSPDGSQPPDFEGESQGQEAPEDAKDRSLLERLLQYAGEYRGLTFSQAWDQFWSKG